MTIDVVLNSKDAPFEFERYHDFWIARELNKAGMPFFNRSLSEGPAAGSMTQTLLEGGSTLYRWSKTQ